VAFAAGHERSAALHGVLDLLLNLCDGPLVHKRADVDTGREAVSDLQILYASCERCLKLRGDRAVYEDAVRG
jgi:hypothetical protein